MEQKKKQLLRVVVGSQAHGLATPESDYDYRGVFIVPTVEFFKLGGTTKTTSWIEGKEDDTSWEIGHFINMAVHCNPTVLETFLAPFASGKTLGELTEEEEKLQETAIELRSLFPYVWNSVDVRNAFIGYGVNQRKKFFDNKDKRGPKYAAAYLRVLYNCAELLETGTFSVNLVGSPIYDQVKNFKEGRYSPGEVIQACFEMETRVIKAFNANPDKKTEVEPVNEFLLKVRKNYWDWR